MISSTFGPRAARAAVGCLAAIIALAVIHHRHRPLAHVATVSQGPLWAAPEPAGSTWPAPAFTDPSGFYTFDCGADESVGATVNLCHDGQVAGVYLDDTTPDLSAWIALADAKYQLVVVGQATNGPCEATGQAFCAREFYPFDCRFPVGSWGPIPPAVAYIGQRWYAWPGCGPPTPSEQQQLAAMLEAKHPRLLILN